MLHIVLQGQKWMATGNIIRSCALLKEDVTCLKSSILSKINLVFYFLFQVYLKWICEIRICFLQ